MKTGKFWFLFCLLISSIHAAETSSATLEKIKKVYQETNKRITKIEVSKESAPSSDISVDHYITNALNRSWEGVGNFKVIYKFYYTHNAPNNSNQIIKISLTTESSRTRINEEFYHNTDGQLIFYFQKTNDPDQPKERRIYFNGEKAIRLIDDQFSRDSYTDGDQELVKAILKKNRSLLAKFNNR